MTQPKIVLDNERVRITQTYNDRRECFFFHVKLKRQIFWREAVGKTIERITTAECSHTESWVEGAYCLLFFTDGTFCTTYGAGSVDDRSEWMIDGDRCLNRGDREELVAAGIVTAEDVQKIDEIRLSANKCI